REMMPQLHQRHLPTPIDGATSGGSNSGGNSFERDLLYKVLFEMKKDLNDLKSLVFELISTNDLEMPDAQHIKSLRLPEGREGNSVLQRVREAEAYTPPAAEPYSPPAFQEEHHYESTIILNEDQRRHYDDSEVIEENLSLEENEKDLISKALKKHQGHRREAAQDLGISERTLYRKIEKYEL
ncbi:MAG: helix-turn-helix domain-containing protein, partial [Bacteroidota bacterium]